MFTFESQEVKILSSLKKLNDGRTGYDVMLPSGEVVTARKGHIVASGECCARCGAELSDRALDLPVWNVCDECFKKAANVAANHTPKEVLAWKTGGQAFGDEQSKATALSLDKEFNCG